MGKLPKSMINFFTVCATLGTLSDRMSMKDKLNRRIIKEGIKALQKTTREGLKELKNICGENKKKIRIKNISHKIIPRLNAPGRIGDQIESIPDSNMVVSLLLI